MDKPKVLTFAGFVSKGSHMANRPKSQDELRFELAQLLRKQNELLESRTFGSATESEILEYELRQEVIHDICRRLANSAAA